MCVDGRLPAVETFELQQVRAQCGCGRGGVGGGFNITREDSADTGPRDGGAVVDDEAEGDARGEGCRVRRGAGDVRAVTDSVGCFREGEVGDACCRAVRLGFGETKWV